MKTLDLKDKEGRLVSIVTDPIDWSSILDATDNVELDVIEKACEITKDDNAFILLVLDTLKGGKRLIEDWQTWWWEIDEMDKEIKSRLLDIIEPNIIDMDSLGEFYDYFPDRCSSLMRTSSMFESRYVEADNSINRTISDLIPKLEEETRALEKKKRMLSALYKAREDDAAALMELVSCFNEIGDYSMAEECLCKSASEGNKEAVEELAQRLYQEKSFFGASYWFEKIASKSKEYAIIRFYGLDGSEPDKKEELFERIFPVKEAEEFVKMFEYAKAFKILDSLKELEDDPTGQYQYLYSELFFNHQGEVDSEDCEEKAFTCLESSKLKGFEPAKQLWKNVHHRV